MTIAPLEEGLKHASSTIPHLLELLPSTMWSVFLSMLPLAILLLVFQFLILHIPPEALRKIIMGFIYSYIGLCFFFLGTNTAFIPTAETLGKLLSLLSYNWIALPIAFVIGGAVVCSEPAAWALIAQVEEISEGNIRTSIMLLALALGTSCFVSLAIAKILFNFSIWYLIIPSYLLA